MNVPSLSPGEPHAIFCPSCAARVAETAIPGATLKCPICGTTFEVSTDGASTNRISDSDQTPTHTVKRATTEEILLERLRDEPPPKKPIPFGSIVLILIGVIAISFAIYKGTTKPDQYAPGVATDTSGLAEHHVVMQNVIDSLEGYQSLHPLDDSVGLTLADAYFDAGNWDKSTASFENYLAKHPSDADARVDYAYALGQKTGNMDSAVAQIDIALRYKPDHLNALVNAGILTTRTITATNHTAALARAKSYFERAKAVADTTDKTAAERIERLILEIDSTGNRLAGPTPQ